MIDQRLVRLLTSLFLLYACVSGFAQDNLAQRLDAREKKITNVKINWNLREERTMFARREVGDPSEVGVKIQYDNTHWDRTTSFAMSRGSGLMVVSGEYHVLNTDRKEVETWPLVLLYGEGFCGAVRYTDPKKKDLPKVVEFVRTSSFGSKSSNPVDGSWTIQPQDLLLLTGQSPRGTYAMNWEYDVTRSGNIVARGVNYDDQQRILNNNLTNHWEFEIEYEKDTLCPVRLVAKQEGREEMEYLIEGSVEVCGERLPRKIVIHHLLGTMDRPMAETTRTWTFVSSEHLDDLSLPLEKGLQVGDFRLDVTDYHRSVFPPKGIEPVLYSWDSRLPTLEELAEIRAGKTFNPEGMTIPKWALPALLFAVGGGWMAVALRRKRRLQS